MENGAVTPQLIDGAKPESANVKPVKVYQMEQIVAEIDDYACLLRLDVRLKRNSEPYDFVAEGFDLLGISRAERLYAELGKALRAMRRREKARAVAQAREAA